MGFFWPEYWNGLPFPTLRDLPDPGIEPILLGLLYWQVDSFPLAPPGKPLNSMRRLSDMTWAAILFPQRLPGERQEKRQIQFYLFYLYPTFPWIPLPPIMNLIQSHGLLNLSTPPLFPEDFLKLNYPWRWFLVHELQTPFSTSLCDIIKDLSYPRT